MNNNWKKIVVICTISGISWILVQNPYTDKYLAGLRSEAVLTVKQKDPLLAEIEAKAGNYEYPPQDARIDSIWKAVPGYNGIKVDIKASYKIMKKSSKFDEKKLIFIQLPPSRHLEDLPSAPIYRAHPDKPVVSFIVNVAWGNEYLTKMLATLKEHGVKATFFLEGRWAKNNPELVKMIEEGGHEIGNHSYSHPDMKTLSSEASKNEIQKTNEVIHAVTNGVKSKWFAPPSGSYREETVNIAASLGMGTIMWSVDTIDWQKPSPDILINRVVSKVHPGAFVLMHPTDSTARSLDTLIKEIKKKNLHIMTVSDALSEKRIIR
ncbi:polysaccharide deacetylase family protein [Peribacillus sp. SCS-155]|uniref:polysaccharide deacetylase family protein n=1 Tax=Peribacillus sedimenti TaxID=3115297 RepID=UPI003905F518